MPAILLSYMAIEKIGRRLGLSIAMLISGVSCGMIQILQGGPLAYLGRILTRIFTQNRRLIKICYSFFGRYLNLNNTVTLYRDKLI